MRCCWRRQERAVVDALVEQPGELTLEHHTRDRMHRLASLRASDELAAPSRAAQGFWELRTAPEPQVERPLHDPLVGRAAPQTPGNCRVARPTDSDAGSQGPGQLRLPDDPRADQRRVWPLS